MPVDGQWLGRLTISHYRMTLTLSPGGNTVRAMSGFLHAVLLAGLSGCAANTRPQAGAVTTNDSPIGYSTVAAALADLSANLGMTVSTQEGWTIIEDRQNHVLWSFTPAGHPAHPAAIKRIVREQDGHLVLNTKALCQAPKEPCDALIAQFELLNAQIREQVQQGLRQQE